MSMDDPFYVGYHDQAPASVAKVMRRLIPAIALLLVASLALLARAQQFDDSAFEFGNVGSFEGIYRADPVAHLRLDDDSVILLVGTGKFAAEVSAESGARVRLDGTRIIRNERIMVEVQQSATQVLAPATVIPVPVRLGPVDIIGEVVGSKCFLGVMNPAHGTVHRACTRHCILGGVPALLRPSDGAGASDPSANGLLKGDAIILVGASLSDLARAAGQMVRVRGSRWAIPGLEWVEADSLTRNHPEELPFAQ
ncbi:MAG: hypothetical protein ACI80V_002240 [Rhodothermales bacterium]|jgi:hypothetical protein